MTVLPQFAEKPELNALARAASDLGYEIVDIAGFLDLVEAQARDQRNALASVDRGASEIQTASLAVQTAAADLGQSVERTAQDVDQSATLVRALGEQSNGVATWVQALSERSGEIGETLRAVKDNNAQIAAISMQVNTLAINAKIEAARAGDAGRGFAVVAEAINELSRKTKDAASQISSNIQALTDWIALMGTEAQDVALSAANLIAHSKDTDDALHRMEASITHTKAQAGRITTHSGTVSNAIKGFTPSVKGIETSIEETTSGIQQAHKRIDRLIDTSETIVQSSAALGGMTEDAPFIAYAHDCAASIATAMEHAVNSGQIGIDALFDRNYVPVKGSNPEQFTTAYTDLLDRLLPPLQEPALSFDPKVVFCACVDVNGYLPTHNLVFAQPQGRDPVWNTANCRNRRIFNDRVGLKAGRNTAPFLLQVYRRDMGGGAFKMMKDISAPVVVHGRHWGGLRLAYAF